MAIIIGLTGGIGSGKSTVAQILNAMDVPVYDCDVRAKYLMNHDKTLADKITDLIGEQAYNADGMLNIPELTRYFAQSSGHVKSLNTIVHLVVYRDLQQWTQQQAANIAAFETAILYEAGFEALADVIWYVSAPQDLRIQRVMQRNNCTAEDVLLRMREQLTEAEVMWRVTADSFRSDCATRRIINDGTEPLLPQVVKQLSSIR